MKHSLSLITALLCSSLAAQTSHGVSCEGGNGLFPYASYPANSFIVTPSTGETVMMLDGVPGAAAVLLIGLHPLHTVNLDLGIIGMPGCFMYTTPFRTFCTVLSPSGVGEIMLPPVPAGHEFLFQWAYLDDNAPRALKVTASDALIASMPTTLPAFRISHVELADPHVFTSVGFCLDLTSTGFNATVNAAITGDPDGDGLLDLNLMFLFRPLDPGASAGVIDFIFPDCTAPIATTSCALAGMTWLRLRYTNSATSCLGTIPNTTNWSVTTPTGPCFTSDPFPLDLNLNGIQVPLEAARISGTYVGNPTTSITNGLIRGFLSEAVADQIVLPLSLPLIGGGPLSGILPGNALNCSNVDARELGPDGTTLGWWIYLNFEAEAVPVVQ